MGEVICLDEYRDWFDDDIARRGAVVVDLLALLERELGAAMVEHWVSAVALLSGYPADTALWELDEQLLVRIHRALRKREGAALRARLMDAIEKAKPMRAPASEPDFMVARDWEEA